MGNGKSVWLVFVLLVSVLAGLVAFMIFRPATVYLEPKPTTGQLSDAVDIDVYVDGSGSIKNFLTAEGVGENYLREFLANLELTLDAASAESGWRDKPVRIWKFGSPKGPELMPRKGDLRDKALNPGDFFTAPKTPIDTAINHAPPLGEGHAELKIVVTDLYQSDGKPEEIAEKHAKELLVGGKGAIAVYAVRNPYAGPVDDLPGAAGALKPGTTSMPFYILVAGDNAADVRHLQQVLLTGSTKDALTHAAKDHLFSAYFSRDPGDFAREPAKLSDKTSADGETDSEKPSGSAELEASSPDGIARVDLRRGQVRVTWPAPQATGLNEQAVTQNLKLRTTAWLLAQGKKASAAPPRPKEDEAALRRISQCRKDQPGLCIVLNRKGLEKGRTYLLQLDLVAGESDGKNPIFYVDSPLMQRWNLSAAEIGHIAASSGEFPLNPALKGGEHPGKTPNLSQLLNAMQNYEFQNTGDAAEPVRAATYYLYVKVR